MHIAYKGSSQASPHAREIIMNDGFLPPLLQRLFEAATPYGTEQTIIDMLPFKDKGTVDTFGNFIISVGDNPTTMFSCHMDTVHRLHASVAKGQPGRIWLVTVEDPDTSRRGWVYGALKKMMGNSTEAVFTPIELGADDKVGVYTMIKMVENNIPGLYVFHVGEEIGSPGSKGITTKTPGLVKGIQRCIAFDRKGYTDVISHQRSERCASKEFTDAVATQLNDRIKSKTKEYQFVGEVRGLFTDSANYRELIPECTNIAVGYFNQHSGEESFDWYWYNQWFLPAILDIKWDELPVKRDPKAKEYTVHTGHYGNYGARDYGVDMNVDKVAAHEVTHDTPYARCPLWTPAEGYLVDATEDGMVRIIQAYRSRTGAWNRAEKEYAASLLEILDLTDELQETEAEVQKLQKALKAAKAAAKPATTLHISPEAFKVNLELKRAMVKQFLKETTLAKLHPAATAVLIELNREIRRKLEGRLRKRNSICTEEMYLMYNPVLLKLMGLFPDDYKHPDYIELRKSLLTFVMKNIDEPGFSQFKQKEDERYKHILEHSALAS